MRKTRTRGLSLVLTLVLILGLLPGTAFAAETPSFDSFFRNIPATASQPPAKSFQWKVVEAGDGGYALRSSTSSYSYSAQAITLAFTADTQISFAYKISSEARHDYLQIKYNGKDLTVDNKVSFSGEVDWSTYALQVEAGKTLEIGLYRDGSGDGGENCVWLRNFSAGDPLTVTFHDGDSTDTQSIFGSGILKANSFIKDRAVFKGWATEAGGRVVYANGASIILEKDIDLYAVWADAYVVTFENSGIQTLVNVEQNAAIGSLIPASPARTGYTFGGWLCDGKAITADTVITSDIICTAEWTPITYTIRLDPNGGTGETVDISAAYDRNIVLPENPFVYPYYDFAGWDTSRYVSSYSPAKYQAGSEVSNLASIEGKTVTLYAWWAGRQVPVTIDLNDDTDESITERTGVVGQNYNYI